MKCRKCEGTKIKTRKYYPYGKRGRAITSRICEKCGSADVDMEINNRRFRRKR
ncbi:hypothetical protein KY362_06460 [Candidatus Woesearchaeota archaeon]|nr:hypothetical protein [Candidatus Woesearchaeota archaeon]